MKPKTKHQKGDIIKYERQNLICICVDKELAVFAPYYPKSQKTKYKDMVVTVPYYRKPESLKGFSYVENKKKI